MYGRFCHFFLAHRAIRCLGGSLKNLATSESFHAGREKQVAVQTLNAVEVLPFSPSFELHKESLDALINLLCFINWRKSFENIAVLMFAIDQTQGLAVLTGELIRSSGICKARTVADHRPPPFTAYKCVMCGKPILVFPREAHPRLSVLAVSPSSRQQIRRTDRDRIC
jgi:hypothetical protein